MRFPALESNADRCRAAVAGYFLINIPFFVTDFLLGGACDQGVRWTGKKLFGIRGGFLASRGRYSTSRYFNAVEWLSVVMVYTHQPSAANS